MFKMCQQMGICTFLMDLIDDLRWHKKNDPMSPQMADCVGKIGSNHPQWQKSASVQVLLLEH